MSLVIRCSWEGSAAPWAFSSVTVNHPDIAQVLWLTLRSRTVLRKCASVDEDGPRLSVKSAAWHWRGPAFADPAVARGKKSATATATANPVRPNTRALSYEVV